MKQSGSATTRIMIVDDHPIVREGFSSLIGSEPDLEVFAQAEGVTGAMKQLSDDPPQLTIVDLSLKDGSGLEFIKDVKHQFPQVKMLAVSMHDELLFAERCLRAGAMGYVNKQQATGSLIKAIRRVLQGKIYLSEYMVERMLCRSIGSDNYSDETPLEKLSDRELEVFEFIGHGETTKKIAESLQLSPKTVDTYRENLKHKLNLDNATELTQHAVQWVLEKQ